MKVLIDGQEVELELDLSPVSAGSDRLYIRTERGSESAAVVRDGEATLISFRGHAYRIEPLNTRRVSVSATASGEVRAPMPGAIVEVRVGVGELVTKGQVLAVLEAMKTQQSMTAPFDGNVDTVNVSVGSQVEEAAIIAVVSPPTVA